MAGFYVDMALKASVTIDVQEAFYELPLYRQEQFIEDNLSKADTDDLIKELTRRGYKIEE